MTEQQYRLIADRDKGDDPYKDDVREGDRVTSVAVLEGTMRTGQVLLARIDRIERPVPTTDEPKRCEQCDDFEPETHEHPSTPTRDEVADELIEKLPPKVSHALDEDQLDAIADAVRGMLSRPTREQIAEAIEVADAEWMEGTHPGATDRDWRLHLTDAVLALIQNGADR